jgi:hypothetical protein
VQLACVTVQSQILIGAPADEENADTAEFQLHGCQAIQLTYPVREADERLQYMLFMLINSDAVPLRIIFACRLKLGLVPGG